MAGVTTLQYYDWENCAAELNMVASLGELSRLASILGIRTSFLFDDKIEYRRTFSPEQLCVKINAHLSATNIDITEFEDRVGFVIGPVLRDPIEVLNWNVDCLRFVCKEIGLDWLAALP